MQRRTLLVALAVAAGGLAGAAPASAQNPRTPGTCQFSRLHLDIGQDNFLFRQGDVIQYTLDLDNVGSFACQVSNVNVQLQLPGPDGNPSSTPQTITTAASYAAQTPSTGFGPFSYTVKVNPGVKTINARTSIANAVLWDGRDSPVNIDKAIAGTVFTPSITIDKVGDKTGPLPAPQAVTYTFYVRNGTDPALDPATTALSNVKVTDDKCGNPTYASGDANGDSKLETNETWAFTCTLTHPAPGTYTNTAVANGENILYGRSVPVVSPPDTWTVVLDAAAVTPASVTACVLSRASRATVRARQLNTIRIRVQNVTPGTTVSLTLPGTKKALTAKVGTNGIATFRVRPRKSGTARIQAPNCSDVERLSVKPARRVQSQRPPRVTG